MDATDQFRQSIERYERQLRARVPGCGEAVVRALLAASGIDAGSDLITGSRIANPGAKKALQFILESSANHDGVAGEALDPWADAFLRACGSLVEAELVLNHCETGFMRLVDGGEGGFAAWIATKREPPGWRERSDFDSWADSLAEQHALPEKSREGDAYRELAEAQLQSMANQFGYPADAVLDGCSVKTYLDIVKILLARSLHSQDRGELNSVVSERQLVAEIASTLEVDVDVMGNAVKALTVDRENAAYHADVPGVAAAPLIRVGADRLVLSMHGLTSQPLLFLKRELRRRAATDYHNSGHLRENVFRQDLYSLFQDKRFVTSGNRIELRRAGGELRTDIDAAIFDRKTGALALFELKSQDPFARSHAELMRRRDNVLYANRQISGVLDWIKRHSANEILNRVDHPTAKKFRVQKVYPFVLARYLVQFNDGPAPDRRAAWGTWPQVLRLLDGKSPGPGDANPLASLFTRLGNDTPVVRTAEGDSSHVIELGRTRLTVYSSFAAFQNINA